jgi:hypothetical protein
MEGQQFVRMIHEFNGGKYPAGEEGGAAMDLSGAPVHRSPGCLSAYTDTQIPSVLK